MEDWGDEDVLVDGMVRYKNCQVGRGFPSCSVRSRRDVLKMALDRKEVRSQLRGPTAEAGDREAERDSIEIRACDTLRYVEHHHGQLIHLDL